MLKSGMSITQMYSAYVEATEQLALEKDKNRLQTQYLDQILKEIEEKAPLLQQQRADYENALLNQVLIWTRDLSVPSRQEIHIISTSLGM